MIRVAGRNEEKQILHYLTKCCGLKVEVSGKFFVSKYGDLFFGSKSAAAFVEHFGKQLRIDQAGVFIGRMNGKEAFSVEGAQLLASFFKERIMLNAEEVQAWMRGYDLQDHWMKEGFVLICNNEDVLGVGVGDKENIVNTLPKERRIKS